MKKTIWKQIGLITLIIMFLSVAIYGLNQHTAALPDNPINDESLESSKVELTANLLNDLDGEMEKEETKEEDTEDEIEEEEIEETEEKDDEKDETEKDEKKNNVKDIEENNNEKTSENKEATNQTTSNEGNENKKDEDSESYRDADGDTEDEDSPNINLNEKKDEDGSEKNEYFTTTITDGETVTTSKYSFRIIYKENEYTVEKTEVFLNGKLEKEFNGDVSLKEGENEIGIKVTYKDKEGELFTVSKTYTVHYAKNDIVISTDLQDEKKVEDSSFTFHAKASYNGNDIPLTVVHNDKKLEGNEQNEYDVSLQEGENLFTLQAKHDGKEKELTYKIIYEKKKDEKITIETDVKDEKVSDPIYTFYAAAKVNDEPIELTTKINGEKIEGDASGNYEVTLEEGENSIHFSATYNGETVEKEYTVTYAKPDGGNEDEDTEQAIKLRIEDLKDGQTLRNSVHTFNVEAIDDDGNRLTDRGVSISATNNGNSIDINWANDAHNSFTMDVEEGTNNITITAQDRDGNIGTKNITVQGEIAGEGEPIGTVTISLEATTIGLGHIIPPTEVDLYANERGSETIDRIFKEYGIEYEYTGSHADSFYLSHIVMPGLYSTTPKIPEDLYEQVEPVADRIGTEPGIDYYPELESLGEFDFTNLSGWMYSVNGVYPNVGFADYYFKDGDTVRIRYTIALGSDIGGGQPGTNFDKEW